MGGIDERKGGKKGWRERQRETIKEGAIIGLKRQLTTDSRKMFRDLQD